MAMERRSHSASARDFILRSSRDMGWGDLNGENIMDIGCGKGANSTHFITELFPDVEEVIAIDNHPEEIEVAKYESGHPKVKYHLADIQSRTSLATWEGKISKVISYYCFHCIENQRSGFENLYHLLTPAGDAAVLFTLESEFFSWTPEIVGRWREFSEESTKTDPPQSQIESLRAPYYEQMYKDIGFIVLRCEDFAESLDFNSDYACRDYLVSMLPFSSNVPRERKKEFADDVLQTYMKYSERNKDGQMCIRYHQLRALIRKPV